MGNYGWIKFYIRIYIEKNLLLTNYYARIQVCLDNDPRRWGWTTKGGVHFTYQYIEKIFKNLFSKTNMPDMLKFVQKHPQLVQVQDCSNDVPRGREGIQWRGQILQRNIKIIFSKTIWQGKLKFVQKHLRALQIQVCLNHVPQEQVEATMGGRVYRGIYRENL